MAFFTPAALAAAAAVASAAATTYAGYQGSQNAQAADKTRAAISANNLQNAQNQEQYQHALDAIAMKRSVAGSTDSRGDQLVYDPATNSWITTLSPSGQRVQSAADSATIGRNTVDTRTSQDANTGAMLDAIKARGAAGTALNKLEAFKPMSPGNLEGALQETATTANRQAQQPVIADTLRQFARTGTAAGPVLTNMMRDNATSLRQTMLNDKIGAMKNVGDINNQQRGGLASTYATLSGAAKPALNFAPINPSGPNEALLSEMAARAGTAPQSASTGAYSLSSSTNANNIASDLAAKNPGQSNAGATLLSSVDSIKSLFNPNGDVINYIKSLGGGSGNEGDLPSQAAVNKSNFGVDPGFYKEMGFGN
jgi:hypothetical protein